MRQSYRKQPKAEIGRIKDKKALIAKLEELGWKSSEPVFQRTYSPFLPDFALANKGIFLRTREEGSRSIFTVKVKRKDKNYFHRDEYEVEVEDAKKVAEMLALLGFSNQIVFEKWRQEWTLNNTTISLDTLPILGEFIEIEGTKKAIEKTIKELELKERITVSYWALYEQKMGKFEGNMVFKREEK